MCAELLVFHRHLLVIWVEALVQQQRHFEQDENGQCGEQEAQKHLNLEKAAAVASVVAANESLEKAAAWQVAKKGDFATQIEPNVERTVQAKIELKRPKVMRKPQPEMVSANENEQKWLQVKPHMHQERKDQQARHQNRDQEYCHLKKLSF